MEMIKFRTKKELLRHLGKNENDNKLVDRLIVRGSVVYEGGMYVLVDKDAIIEELKEEIKNLKEQQGKNTLSEGSMSELEEAKIQWEYWEKECRRYGRLINLVMEVVYKRIKPLLGSRIEDYEEFKEGVIEDVKRLETD